MTMYEFAVMRVAYNLRAESEVRPLTWGEKHYLYNVGFLEERIKEREEHIKEREMKHARRRAAAV